MVAAGIDAELLEAQARESSTAHRFLELASDAGADLIMFGSHGSGSLAGVFLGSFAHELLEIAPCPVLVVPWTHPDI